HGSTTRHCQSLRTVVRSESRISLVSSSLLLRSTVGRGFRCGDSNHQIQFNYVASVSRGGDEPSGSAVRSEALQRRYRRLWRSLREVSCDHNYRESTPTRDCCL